METSPSGETDRKKGPLGRSSSSVWGSDPVKNLWVMSEEWSLSTMLWWECDKDHQLGKAVDEAFLTGNVRK